MELAKTIVGSLLLVLYPHELSFHEYLRAWEGHYSLFTLHMAFWHVPALSTCDFYPLAMALSQIPLFPCLVNSGKKERRRTLGGREDRGREGGGGGREGRRSLLCCSLQVKSCMYSKQIQLGSFPIFGDCVCESLWKPITQEWVSENPRWPIYASLGCQCRHESS